MWEPENSIFFWKHKTGACSVFTRPQSISGRFTKTVSADVFRCSGYVDSQILIQVNTLLIYRGSKKPQTHAGSLALWWMETMMHNMYPTLPAQGSSCFCGLFRYLWNASKWLVPRIRYNLFGCNFIFTNGAWSWSGQLCNLLRFLTAFIHSNFLRLYCRTLQK